MKRWLQGLLVLVVLLAAAGYLLLPLALKSVLEREGSQALKAELNIASVDVGLFPPGLTLHDVQVTNPQQPLRNLVVIERAVATVEISALRKRQLLADVVQLQGLRFNQSRLRSGAIAGLTPPVPPAPVSAGLTGVIGAADVAALAQLPATGLTQALIGAEFAPLIAQVTGLANLTQGAAIDVRGAAADSQPAWPLLARTVEVDGRFDFGAQPLAFTGVIHNLTSQPLFWNVATDIALQAAPQSAPQSTPQSTPLQPARFALNGTLDQRKGVVADVRLTLAGLPLGPLPLSRTEPLRIDLDSAVLDVEGLLRMEGRQIDFGLFGLFKQAKLQITPGADALAQRLAIALRTINQFDVNVLMVGDVGAPRVQLQSSLDPILAAAIGDAARAQNPGMGGVR